MNDNLELVFNQYNDFFQTGYHIRSNQTALKILKTGFRDLEDLQNKVREHEIKKLKQMVKGDYQDLKSLIEFEQPKSIFLYVIYIDIVLDSIEDGFF